MGRQGSGRTPATVNSGGREPAAALQPGVDPGGVGLQAPAHGGIETPELFLDEAMEAERPHEAVGRDGIPTRNLRQAPGAQATHGFHLPKAVLGMDESQGEVRVGGGLGEDMRNSPPITQDLRRRLEAAGHLHGALGKGQRRVQPEETADRPTANKQAEHIEDDEREAPQQPSTRLGRRSRQGHGKLFFSVY